MMFESSKYNDGFFDFVVKKNRHRLCSLKRVLAANKMIPLGQLVGLNPVEVLAVNDRDSVSAFYAQSYALVRFLREENFGEHFTDYRKMMEGGLYGKWPINVNEARIAADRNIRLTVGWNRYIGLKLFREYVTEDIDKLNEDYITFCRKIVYHVH